MIDFEHGEITDQSIDAPRLECIVRGGFFWYLIMNNLLIHI